MHYRVRVEHWEDISKFLLEPQIIGDKLATAFTSEFQSQNLTILLISYNVGVKSFILLLIFWGNLKNVYDCQDYESAYQNDK